MSRENRQEWEIEQVSGGLRVRVLTNDPAKQQPWTFIPCSAIKQVTGSYLKNFGQVLSNNQRKNPIRETNRVMITISFHDENESSPISYDLNYVHNQPTWTPNVAGLNRAITDISSWCGAAGTAIVDIAADVAPQVRRASVIRATSAGGILSAVYDISVENVGLADGTFHGATLSPGEGVSFNAGALNNTYPGGNFSYDATGTEFLIIYNS